MTLNSLMPIERRKLTVAAFEVGMYGCTIDREVNGAVGIRSVQLHGLRRCKGWNLLRGNLHAGRHGHETY